MNDRQTNLGASVATAASAAAMSPHATAQARQSRPSDSNSPELWSLVHRALRGRYAIAISLAVIGGTIGAAAGWMTAPRVFRSEGLVRIASSRPRVIQETDQNKPMEMFDAFLQAQQALIGSRKMVDVAMQDPAWKQREDDGQSRTVEQFSASLKVEIRPRSDCIRVLFFDEDPMTAAAGVGAMINAYQGIYQKEQSDFEQQRLDLLQERRASLADSVKQCDAALGAVEPTPAKPDSLAGEQRQLSDFEIAMRDPLMRSFVEEQSHRDDELALARQFYGDAHPTSRRAAFMLARAQERIAQYSVQYHAFAPAAVTRDAQFSTMDPARLRRLQDAADDAHKELASVEHRIQSLKTEGAVAGRLTVVTAGDVPSVPFQNSGKKMAALGGFAGAGFPVALLTMMGLMRRRYSCAIHAAQDFATTAPFFAIVPALGATPNKHYPAAAHAIHRIRVKLQPQSEHKSLSYLVTSASCGEGKTGTASALALSFTAAGHRTLLIDADMRNRSLTNAFKAQAEAGLIESLAAGGALQHVKMTRSGMSVLLTGQVDKFQPGTLSVASLRRLLANARDAYDVVVIDAGCVMESPEALTIAGEVDGVIGTISRGQTSQQVRRMLQELQTVDASIAGMIFNRTALAEFYEALRVSPAPQNRAAVTTAMHVSQFGPLTAAILHSMQLMRSEDNDLVSNEPHLAMDDTTKDVVTGSVAA